MGNRDRYPFHSDATFSRLGTSRTMPAAQPRKVTGKDVRHAASRNLTARARRVLAAMFGGES